ncbi:MAG: hypothetical protein BWY91_03101 [bacterium ADurb.BinA028]|nr:MAG: hypothetical protein BWY91_03101 [bacterium ADurb.BinA028]
MPVTMAVPVPESPTDAADLPVLFVVPVLLLVVVPVLLLVAVPGVPGVLVAVTAVVVVVTRVVRPVARGVGHGLGLDSWWAGRSLSRCSTWRVVSSTSCRMCSSSIR